MSENSDGWEANSKLVLKQLDMLADGISSITEELKKVNREITDIRIREDRIRELKEWKEKVDDVTSPINLKDALKKIEELEHFKTRAVTVFAIVQFLTTVAISLIKFF